MYNLLIVEDEKDIREGLINFIDWQEVGFNIVASLCDGTQAVEFLKSNNCHIVMSDIRMPKMDGIQLTKYIHENYVNTKIVLLSGYKDFEYAQEAIRYGVKEYILKSAAREDVINIFKKIKEEMDKNSYLPVPVEEEELNYNDNTIKEIKDYVNKNYQLVTLELAALQVHMNPFYLSRYFKKHTNENFSDYVQRVKMSEAAKLLVQPKRNIAEVSALVGYNNPKSFSKMFKQIYGVTPLAYRTNKIGGDIT